MSERKKIAKRLVEAGIEVAFNETPLVGSVVTMAKAVAGPTGDDGLAAGQVELDRADLGVVPELARGQRRLDALVASLSEQSRALGERVMADLPRPGLALLAEIGREADQRGVPWSELEASPEFTTATRACVRAAMEDPDPTVIRPLARLALRFRDAPRDRTFRAVVRLLLDLDGRAVPTMRRLIAAAAEGQRRWERLPDDVILPEVLTLSESLVQEGDEVLTFVEWGSLPPVVIEDIPPRDGAIEALRRYVGREPRPEGTPDPVVTEGLGGGGHDRRILELEYEVLDVLVEILRPDEAVDTTSEQGHDPSTA